MDDLDDILTLAEAAELLDRSAVTLRAQAATGRFKARRIGSVWLTTRAEVERYRHESLGRPGRPANLLEQRPPFEDVLKPGEPNLLEDE